jgi:hypothetical protein
MVSADGIRTQSANVAAPMPCCVPILLSRLVLSRRLPRRHVGDRLCSATLSACSASHDRPLRRRRAVGDAPRRHSNRTAPA